MNLVVVVNTTLQSILPEVPNEGPVREQGTVRQYQSLQHHQSAVGYWIERHRLESKEATGHAGYAGTVAATWELG